MVDHVQLTITDTGAWKSPEVPRDIHRGRGIGLMRALMQDVTIAHDATGTTVHLYARMT